MTQIEWEECLASIGFTEQKNPNGANCFDVYNEAGLPIWQYSDEDGKQRLFDFFSGISYAKARYGFKE